MLFRIFWTLIFMISYDYFFMALRAIQKILTSSKIILPNELSHLKQKNSLVQLSDFIASKNYSHQGTKTLRTSKNFIKITLLLLHIQKLIYIRFYKIFRDLFLPTFAFLNKHNKFKKKHNGYFN